MARKRINIVDTWRGLAIICMVIYHLLYDIEFIFSRDLEFFSIPSWYGFQQFTSWSFIFLAGFSHKYSRKPSRNAIKILITALILTLVTRLANPSAYIRFGVLHLIGSAMALVLILELFIYTKKKFQLTYGLLSFVVFFIIWNFGLEVLPFYESLAAKEIFYPLGFIGPGFVSIDYFGLLPWFFLYLSGFFIGSYHKYRNPFLEKIDLKENILGKIGRHSFFIYLAHQPVLLGLLSLIFKFL
ncbi:MAG: heparan-alpha-glucosaminide N-acetyltransferase domain-containing protein [Bacillota bacterium]|nr:heparan-alpha-glucosaminide N-acetyltransferase domain-containing protein [Bacillota bacterium]